MVTFILLRDGTKGVSKLCCLAKETKTVYIDFIIFFEGRRHVSGHFSNHFTGKRIVHKTMAFAVEKFIEVWTLAWKDTGQV